MKKKYKWIFIALIIVCSALIVGDLGVKHMERINEQANLEDNPPVTHENMVRIVKAHEDVVDKWLLKDDKKKQVKIITIEYDKLDHNPMGGIDIYGYVNGDKKLEFNATLDKEGSKYVIDGGGITKPLGILMGSY
ncbi:DUF1310 family protein [Ligilactobacillus sp. LYQ139]|uniref:DUF1310 family protein n=1 Tax=Ligilactobacillus sp. LYQ139 TaxID=3378800 RepID=UPI003852D6BB